MHPRNLHARAAAWSLHHARQALAEAVRREAAEQRADALATAAAANIQAWRPMIGRGSGGHGDPVSLTVCGIDHVHHGQLRPRQLARLATQADGTLRWLAFRTAPGEGDPLQRLIAAIPGLTPFTAEHLTRWLAEADQRIRDILALDDDLVPLAGVPCPYCSTRLLHAHTAAPDSRLWTVICGAGCHCVGPGCPCGMTVLEASVGHIWDRSTAWVALHLERIVRRRFGYNLAS